MYVYIRQHQVDVPLAHPSGHLGGYSLFSVGISSSYPPSTHPNPNLNPYPNRNPNAIPYPTPKPNPNPNQHQVDVPQSFGS